MIAVTVQQGQIHVNDLWVEYESPECIIVGGDLRAKYAGCAGGGSADGGPLVALFANDHTLHREESVDMTVIRFSGLPGWSACAVEVSRYTLTIVLRIDRMGDDRRTLWTDDSPPVAVSALWGHEPATPGTFTVPTPVNGTAAQAHAHGFCLLNAAGECCTAGHPSSKSP